MAFVRNTFLENLLAGKDGPYWPLTAEEFRQFESAPYGSAGELKQAVKARKADLSKYEKAKKKEGQK